MVTLDQAGSALGYTRLYAPPAHLAGIVELAWTQRMPGDVAASWRIVADVGAHLLAHGLRAGGVRVSLVGARTRWVDAPAHRRVWTAGVRLLPGALPVLARVGASGLTDRGFVADDVWGGAGQELTERIAGVSGPAAALEHLLAFLATRLVHAADIDTRIPALVDGLGTRRAGERLRDLAADLGMAERTLRQACTDHIGLSPVRVVRIERLHRVLGMKLAAPGRGWASLAAHAGYADQPHMIRDFRALLGEAPETFVARGARSAAVSFNRDPAQATIVGRGTIPERP